MTLSFWPGYSDCTSAGDIGMLGPPPPRKAVKFVSPTVNAVPSFSMFPMIIGTFAVAPPRRRSRGSANTVTLNRDKPYAQLKFQQ
jgi:hypothetical protein